MIEIINDRDSDITNFFRVLRSNPNGLIEAIDLTPYSRDEYLAAYDPTDEPLEKARRFYVRCWQSFGGSPVRRTGWRVQRNEQRGSGVVSDWRRHDGLRKAVARLQLVQIENDEASAVIERFDTPKTLFYADPPYVMSSRSEGSRPRYKHEMTDQDHCALADKLHKVQGMVLLSGYNSDLYADLYGDWLCLSKTTTTSGNSVATEYLWINPQAAALSALPLFDHSVTK